MLSRSICSLLLNKVYVNTPFDHQPTSLPHVSTAAKILENLNKSTSTRSNNVSENSAEDDNIDIYDAENIDFQLQKLSAIVDEVKTAYIHAEAAHRSYYRRYKSGLNKVKKEAQQILQICSSNNNNNFSNNTNDELSQWARNKCVHVRDPLDNKSRWEHQIHEKEIIEVIDFLLAIATKDNIHRFAFISAEQQQQQ